MHIDFLKQAGGGAVAVTALSKTASAQSKANYLFAKGRVIGAKEFKAKTGEDKLMVECAPQLKGAYPHMDNFLDAMRSRQEPNLGAELGYKVMAAIRMGVDAYRQQTRIRWDERRQRAIAKA
jgi:hypothetical protein